jgi:1-acyl-sn-glycerol-3-phosphate acyltransferase
MKLLALTYRISLINWHIFRGVITSALVLPWVSPASRDRLIQNWSIGLLRKLRITVQVHGTLPSPGQMPVVLTSNHISWVDIFAIHSVRPVRFVSKAEVRHWPVFGWLAAKTGTLFLVRTSRKQTAAIGGEMEKVLSLGDSLGLFPESTTSEGHSVLPFRSAMLQAAVSRQTPILPVALQYRLHDGTANPHLPFVGEMTFAHSLIKVLTAPPSQVQIRVGSLVHPTQMHRRELAQRLEQITLDLLLSGRGHHDASAFHKAPEIKPDLPVAPQ